MTAVSATLALAGCNSDTVTSSAPPSTNAPQIKFTGSSIYSSINPTISFSVTDSAASAITGVTFELDPSTSPWAVEQQNIPASPTCQLSNGTCSGTLSFTNLYATPHTLVLNVTDNQGNQSSATYSFTIALTQSAQVTAANTVATTNVNCVGTGGSSTGITPFYWEIGNASSGSTPLASGSVTASGQTVVTRSTPFNVDSASKMISGAFMLSQSGVQPWSTYVSEATKTFLHFASGYTNFQDISCAIRELSSSTNSVALAQDTVLDCYTACCIVDNTNSVILDAKESGGGVYELCGNLVTHANASTMISSLEGSGVISSAEAARSPSVVCNNDYVSSTAGSFYYSGGHLQRYAVAANATAAPNPGDGFTGYGIDISSYIGDRGLTGSTSLATEYMTQFGLTSLSSDFQFSFPQMAGGIYTDAIGYASILQQMLSGTLSNYLTYLGKDPICAYTQADVTALAYSGVKVDACTGSSGYALYSPINHRLMHYSYTDWVEDDPTLGDGAMSSAGLDGEYPWIDASKTYYGLVHRSDTTGAQAVGQSLIGQGYQSLMCGSLIRQAFLTGVVPPNTQTH